MSLILSINRRSEADRMSSFNSLTSGKSLLDIGPDFCINPMKFITLSTKVWIPLGEERRGWSSLQTFFCTTLQLTLYFMWAKTTLFFPPTQDGSSVQSELH